MQQLAGNAEQACEYDAGNAGRMDRSEGNPAGTERARDLPLVFA
jgi:hypothetical protein